VSDKTVLSLTVDMAICGEVTCYTNLNFNTVWDFVYMCPLILYTNIDQTLVNSLHGLLNFEIGEFDCPVITTEYLSQVHCIHM